MVDRTSASVHTCEPVSAPAHVHHNDTGEAATRASAKRITSSGAPDPRRPGPPSGLLPARATWAPAVRLGSNSHRAGTCECHRPAARALARTPGEQLYAPAGRKGVGGTLGKRRVNTARATTMDRVSLFTPRTSVLLLFHHSSTKNSKHPLAHTHTQGEQTPRSNEHTRRIYLLITHIT